MNSEKKPFTENELRLLDNGRLAVLNLVIRALAEAHPEPEKVAKAFKAKADAAKTLMRDLAGAQASNPLEAFRYPPAFQARLDDEIALWLEFLNQQSAP